MSLNTYPYNPFPASTDKLDEAHNAELQQEIDQLKSGLTTLDNEVNGDATVYPYADVITIPDAIPANVANCTVKIEPVQSGSGDPSPTNIRPITGHTEASVQRDGKNLFDKNNAGNINEQGLNPETGKTYVTTSGWTTSSFIKIEPSTTYTLTTTSVNSAVAFYDSEKVYISGASPFGTKTTPSNAKYLRFDYKTENAGIMQLELGQTATPYVPYVEPKTYTIALGDTIYGGTVDFDSGVMTVTHTLIEFDGTENWRLYGSGSASAYAMALTKDSPSPKPDPLYCISNSLDVIGAGATYGNYDAFISTNSPNDWIAGIRTITTPEDWKTYLTSNPVQLCYPLATPFTVQLTPQRIQLLKGQNTLTASTGQISVTVNGVSGAIGSLQTQANATYEALAELADKLPTAPTTDGAYVLTVTVADGTPTYSWESAS